MQEELTVCHKRSTEAEAGRAQALQDLESTHESRPNLKMAQNEDAQARQESELAQHRLRTFSALPPRAPPRRRSS
jgi:hypothetical protein